MIEPPPEALDLLRGRYVATLATENVDGSSHLTAVWYVFRGGLLHVATAGTSRKARNAAARKRSAMLIDARGGHRLRGVAAVGHVHVLQGDGAQRLNHEIRSRYLTDAGLAAPEVGGRMRRSDDVTLAFEPARWWAWDLGKAPTGLGGEPYFRPLDR